MSSTFNQTHPFLVTESEIVCGAKQHDSPEIIIFAYFKCVSTAGLPESSTACILKHEASHYETYGTQIAISPQSSTICRLSKRRLMAEIPIRSLNKVLFVM
jgi:hypothetical protein